MASRSDPATDRNGVVAFDGFEVDLGRRELTRDGRRIQLQEKPWRLLAALVQRPGVAVSREELCSELWPGVEHLDFDANLNAAARKLRRALGDSADDPRWLVTVPGHGYRLDVDLEAPTSPAAAPTDTSRGRGIAAAVALLAVVATAAILFGWRQRPATPTPPVRLAIMPFELQWPAGAQAADLARISEWLLAETATRWRPGVEVVGPRTTARYRGVPFPDLERMAEELSVDYVLNARPLHPDEGGELQLLVELIRLDDRSHPWVELYDETSEWQTVATDVRDGVEGVITR